MIWCFGRHFALVVLVCVVAGKREISLCVVPGGGHFVLVLYVWYAKDVDLSRGKTNEVPIVLIPYALLAHAPQLNYNPKGIMKLWFRCGAVRTSPSW